MTRAGVEAFARLLIDRPKAVFVWSMGLTQHAHGVDTVRALVNLGLARGLPARPGSGLVPIRGHSGVQGGAEVGCVPAVPAETRARWAEVWGFDPPAQPGWTATEADHRERGRRGRHVLDGRRQHARDAAGHGGGRACAGAAAPAHPSGHRAVDVDAGRGRRRRAAAAGDDALRIAGRRHRDVDRAAHHLLARDPGPARRIREAGVVGVPRGDGAGLPGARRISSGSRTPRQSGARSIARCRSTPASPDCRARATSCSGADAASTPTAASPRPTAAPASRPSRCAAARSRPIASSSRRGAASSSTRWCSAPSIRSPAPIATTS